MKNKEYQHDYKYADRYYINPYEIAVQRGFRGSVDEWLASLKGDPGQGLAILGLYASLEALRQSVPTPEAGNCYAVGDADENTIYCWNGTAWQDIGPIKGDQGETGPTGPQGVPGSEGKAAAIAVKTTTTGAPNSEAQVVNEGTANAAQLVFTIPRGATARQAPRDHRALKETKATKGIRAIKVILALKDLKVRLVRRARPDRRAQRVILVTMGLLLPLVLMM